mmetsp:Transcript_110965/g.358216  ORF Transcript_110965/g.358216 Transcript_110965/m.358216 type:complete len:225 (-) Transcript_110965:476-1150(-)
MNATHPARNSSFRNAMRPGHCRRMRLLVSIRGVRAACKARTRLGAKALKRRSSISTMKPSATAFWIRSLRLSVKHRNWEPKYKRLKAMNQRGRATSTTRSIQRPRLMHVRAKVGVLLLSSDSTVTLVGPTGRHQRPRSMLEMLSSSASIVAPHSARARRQSQRPESGVLSFPSRSFTDEKIEACKDAQGICWSISQTWAARDCREVGSAYHELWATVVRKRSSP